MVAGRISRNRRISLTSSLTRGNQVTPRQVTAAAHQQYRTRIEHAANQILRDREEARDIASDTFVAMLERGPVDEGAALAWLLTTSRRRALNRVRDRARAHRRALRLVDPPVELAMPTDERVTSIVRDACSRLSDRDRMALELRYVSEEPIERISEALSVNTATARVIVHRAVRRLRRETVRALAEHHAIPTACLDELTRRAESGRSVDHPGCGKCSVVADEVGAIAATGLMPILGAPILRKFTDAIDKVAGSVRVSRAPGLASRVPEAAAALLLSVAAAALPAQSIAATNGHAPKTITAISVKRSTPRIAAPAAARVKPVSTRNVAQRSRASTVQEDALGDNQPAWSPTELAGPILTLPDALAGKRSAGTDITRFSIATGVDTKGRPNRLLARIDLDAVAPKDATYEVSWIIPNTVCTGSMYVYSDGWSPTGSIYCAGGYDGLLDFTSESSSWNLPITVLHDGAFVEFQIDLAKVPADAQRYLRPGSKLGGLFARSAAGMIINRDADAAPDAEEARPNYTIEK